jgi:hypothetical protein
VGFFFWKRIAPSEGALILAIYCVILVGMDKDIVERLREPIDVAPDTTYVEPRICAEAADEIERLRNEIQTLRKKFEHQKTLG